MLSMNGIIVCELILGGVLISLIFTSLADTDLIADRSSKSENDTQADGFRTVPKPGLALTEISPDVHARFSGRLLGESDGGGSGPSGKENKPRTIEALGDQRQPSLAASQFTPCDRLSASRSR